MVAEDAGPLLRVFADPVVMASFGVEPFGRPQMDHWVARNLEHQDQYGFGLLSRPQLIRITRRDRMQQGSRPGLCERGRYAAGQSPSRVPDTPRSLRSTDTSRRAWGVDLDSNLV